LAVVLSHQFADRTQRGIDADTIKRVVDAGATVVVAGSAVYNGKTPVAENIKRLREALA
jgi:pentose-5-phosphate-3-epimerase